MTEPATRRLCLASAACMLLLIAPLASARADSGVFEVGARLVEPELLDRNKDPREAAKIAFFESRIAADPHDFLSLNQLAEIYLRRLGRTGDHHDLLRARSLAEASTRQFPGIGNERGLLVLSRVELADHRFDRAAERARDLIGLLHGNPAPVLILGDALLESGDYAGADRAYRSVMPPAQRDPGIAFSLAARQGRLAWLMGQNAEAERQFARALTIAESLPAGNEHELAWIQWQIGITAFARGDRAAAWRAQRAALTSSPGYARAIAALAQLHAAEGDLADAMALYERAVELTPHISFVSALADIYDIAGQPERARVSYHRAERIGLEPVHASGQPTGWEHGHAGESPSHHGHEPVQNSARDLALFYADHDLEPAHALRLAQREYSKRKDIYTADVLAWTALKAGDLDLARSAVDQALRLGTQDPGLFYHAALVAHASGDSELAKARLESVSALNPEFDPRQGAIAMRLLNRLSSGGADGPLAHRPALQGR